MSYADKVQDFPASLPATTPLYGLSCLSRGPDSYTQLADGASVLDATWNFWLIENLIAALQAEIDSLTAQIRVMSGSSGFVDCGTF